MKKNNTNTTNTNTNNTAIRMDSNTLLVKSNSLEFAAESAVPSIIINAPQFFTALNAELVKRHEITYNVKLAASIKTLNNASEDMKKYEAGTDEYNQALSRAEKATANRDKFQAILNSVTALKPEYASVETPADSAEIVKMYAMLYSTAAAIDTEKNKVKAYELTGVRTLWNACREYADKYESVESTWAENRKEEFKVIKSKLEAVGSRLNGEATANRKGFKYSSSVKDVNRLIALVTKQAAHNNGNGKFEEKRVNFEAFQRTVICTVFRMNEEDFISSDVVEC